MLGTKTYQAYGDGKISASLLHFAFSKNYLRRNLSIWQRARLARNHVAIEEESFDESYFSAIYDGDGLELWSHPTAGETIRIVLSLGLR